MVAARLKRLLEDYPWIRTEKANFGRGQYDFTATDPAKAVEEYEECMKRLQVRVRLGLGVSGVHEAAAGGRVSGRLHGCVGQRALVAGAEDRDCWGSPSSSSNLAIACCHINCSVHRLRSS